MARAPAPCRMPTTRRKRHAPSMLTTDLALRFDPAYEKISRRFHREPGPVRRCLRPRLVQAHPSRHGPARALPRARGAGRRADLAGSDSRRRSPADRRRRTSPRLKAKILASGLYGRRSSSRRPGPRPRPSAAPTSAAARTARASAWRRRRIGQVNQPAQARQGARRRSKASRASSTPAQPAARRSRSPI